MSVPHDRQQGAAGARSKLRAANSKQLERLEVLVDELVKESPREDRVRACMEAAGIDYIADPISRMKMVLSILDHLRKSRRQIAKEQL